MSIILTCNVTGKQVTWTNQSIINKKIAEYGSLEAFKAAYVSRDAKAKQPPKKSGMSVPQDGDTGLMKAILQDGVKLAPKSITTRHLTNADYIALYQSKIEALQAAGASQREISWMKQRLERWRS